MSELAAGASRPSAQLQEPSSTRPATRRATTPAQRARGECGRHRLRTAGPPRHRGADGDPGAGPAPGPVSVAVTMRTPGNDFELAAGFLVSEGLVHGLHEVAGIRYCDVAPEEQHYNVVTVDLTVPFTTDFAERHFFASSSCGICGKASLDQVEVNCPVIEPGPVVARSTICLVARRVAPLPAHLRADRRPSCCGAVRSGGAPRRVTRGRRAPQRGRQAHR